MNRIAKRALALWVLVIFLVGGVLFFVGEFMVKGSDWVVFSGSPHVYNGTNLGFGQVVDRDGKILLDVRDGRNYAEDPAIRKSTMHWLGDRKGHISAPALSHYAKAMTGFDLVNGLYNYGGAGGQASLTISSDIQTVALEAMGNRKGTIGVYNYKTGEILCAVTTPNYDPDHVPNIDEDTSGAYEGVYLNRFTQSVYIPGSIFKAVTTAAVLEEMPEILDKTFTCTGTVKYEPDKVTCERPHGKVNLKNAMAQSCNCAYAQIVDLLGPETLAKYVTQFGVTDPLQFDGVTTAAGKFNIDGAAPVQSAWAGIGQYTDQVNPCRFMTFMGAIAGGGQSAEPHLVSGVTVGRHSTYDAKTVMSPQIMSEKTAKILQEYMRNNVETKYGAKNFPGLTVCAKSGTSQVGGGKTSNAMFAGFVTDEAYPLAFMVVVENGGYGSSTCVPILSKVLAACKTMMDGR